VFLIFPKEFERNQFLIALDQNFIITYFESLYGKVSALDGSHSDAYLVRFGRREDKEKKKEEKTHDDTKDQYFAILACLRTSDVDFAYALMHLIKEIKRHDQSPALILVGTAGGPEYLKAGRIQKAYKFDRGEMSNLHSIEIDEKLTVSETFPGLIKKGCTTHCSNWLMHFSKGGDFLDMESFEFCKVCKYMDIVDYACVRICSDTPSKTANKVLENVKKMQYFGMTENDFVYSQHEDEEEKQKKTLQKLLRKCTDFTNAVTEVLPILKEYTLKRIRSIPNNNYESGQTKKLQEHLIQRHINEKLNNIYTFPLQDEEYFITNQSSKKEVLEDIREKQSTLIHTLHREFTGAAVKPKPGPD